MNVPTSLPSASLCFFLPLSPLRSYSIYYSRSPSHCSTHTHPLSKFASWYSRAWMCGHLFSSSVVASLAYWQFFKVTSNGKKGREKAGLQRQEEDERRCTPLCDLGTRRWNTRRVFCQPSIIESWAQAITLQRECWQAHLQAEGHRSCLLP